VVFGEALEFGVSEMANAKEILDNLLKKVSDLSDQVKQVKESGNKENIEKSFKDLLDSREEALRATMVSEVRKGRFSADDDDEEKAPHEMIVSKARSDSQRDFQRWNDQVYLVSKILKTHPSRLKIWKDGMAGPVSELKKAMDTATAAEGLEWVPTEFSADLTDRVRLAMKVSGLFRHIPMPSNPFKLPVVASDGTAYLVGESTIDGTDSKITASTPGTRNLSLTAKKLGARVLYSEEMSEDSIIATSSFVLDNMAIAIAAGLETGFINGSTSATHMDSDVSASTDARKAFDGLRKAVLSTARQDLSTFSTANLRSMRFKMGKYGIDPSKLCYITGPKGMKQFLGLAEVITVDKYGALATVLSGEMGKFDGIPIVVSEYVREDVATTGSYDGTVSTKTTVLLTYVPTWIIGDRRKVTVKTWEDVERDQTVVVSTVRNAFGSLHDSTTEKIVALGHNVDAS
jgi:HK97 family phage major capsid protein